MNVRISNIYYFSVKVCLSFKHTLEKARTVAVRMIEGGSVENHRK